MNETNYEEKIRRLKNMTSTEHQKTVELIVPLHTYYANMMIEVKKVLEKKYDFSKSELDLLMTLAASDETAGILAPTILYEHLLFSSGGMTKLLKKLESKEYIQRHDNPEDKRSKLVGITEKGRDIAVRATNDVLALETKCFSSLDENEKNQLSKILKKLI